MRFHIISLVLVPLIAVTMSSSSGRSHLIQAVDEPYYEVVAKTQSNLSKPIEEEGNSGKFELFSHAFFMKSDSTGWDSVSLINSEYDSDNVFMLNSNPDGLKTIFLDFDGAVLSGTNWNLNVNNKSELTYPALNFNALEDVIIDERAAIYYTWAIISENFAQFDVNITTQPPEVDKMLRSSEEDEEYGLHVIFTTHSLEGLEDCECNGLAPLSTFGEISTDSTPSPAFVNPQFGPEGYQVKSAVEAAWVLAHIGTHEIGHMLGLEHDGKGNDEEYSSPIGPVSFFMGGTPRVSKYARWSDGAIANSIEETKGYMVNREDDLLILARQLGLKKDDFPDSIYDPNIPSQPVEAAVSGILSHHTDRDVYAVQVPSLSLLRVEVKPYAHNYQLAAKVQVFDKDFVPLSDFSSKRKWRTKFKNGKAQTVDFSSDIEILLVEPGIYYLQVESGEGWPFFSTVHGQNYGSVGRWRSQVDLVPLEEKPAPSESLMELYLSLQNDVSD